MSILDELADKLLALPEDQRREIAMLAKSATSHLQHWVPNPGPQTDGFFCEADELFYGGEAGGGKTDLLLGCAMNNHRRSLILRRLNGEVNGLIERMEAIIGNRRGLKQSPPAYWRLKDRLIKFGGCQHPDDWQKYMGDPKDFIGFDEVTNFLESQFRAIVAWNRSVIAGQRVRVIAAGNPPTTPEGMWVIKYWAPWLDPHHPNPAVDGELRWFTTVEDQDMEVDGPGPVIIDGVPLLDSKGKPILPKSRTFIRAQLSDNPDLEETGYGSRLAALPGPMRAAMFEGDFATSIKDDMWQVFPTAWVEAAMNRWSPEGGRGKGMDALGVDIAQGGADHTVLSAKHGAWFDQLKVYAGKDTPDGPSVASLVMFHMRDRAEIMIDMGGGWGGSTVTQLKSNGLNPSTYNGSTEGLGRDRTGEWTFYNKRARDHWRLREAMDPEFGAYLALPPDPELKADLCSIRWTPQGKKIKVLSKEEIKKIIGRSPDRSDAVVMAHSAEAKTWVDEHGMSTLPKRANLSPRRPPRR